MMRELTREQKRLIESFVGQEAKRTGLGPARLYSHVEDHTKMRYNDTSPEKTKGKIYESFEGDYDAEAVKRGMLEYINSQIEIAGEFNPSFQILKDRIDRGEYDFDFSKYAATSQRGSSLT